MIRDEKMQYDINKEAAKTSALSSWKLDKYQYLTGEGILLSNERQTTEQPKFAYSPLGKVSLTGGGILPSNQRKTTEQTRFAYSPLGKAFRKQTKTSEDQA